MPKSTLPSTEKKSAKPKVVTTTTRKKKNDTSKRRNADVVDINVGDVFTFKPVNNEILQQRWWTAAAFKILDSRRKKSPLLTHMTVVYKDGLYMRLSSCEKDGTVHPCGNSSSGIFGGGFGPVSNEKAQEGFHNTWIKECQPVQPNEEKDVRLCEINSFLTSYIQMHLKTLGAAVADGRIPASIIPYPVSNGYSRFSLFYDDNDEGEKEVRYEFEKQGEEDVVTIDCQRNVDHAFNLFIDDMKGQGISDVTYGAVINQFCHNMHAGVVAVGKAFNDNSDEYIIKTAPGSTDGVYVGQTWRLKSDDGPRVVIVRVGNGDVFYCFGQETETYMSLGFDVEMIDRKDLQTFTRLFCKEADHADVMRERKAKAVRLGLVWPLGGSKPSAATKK